MLEEDNDGITDNPDNDDDSATVVKETTDMPVTPIPNNGINSTEEEVGNE